VVLTTRTRIWMEVIFQYQAGPPYAAISGPAFGKALREAGRFSRRLQL